MGHLLRVSQSCFVTFMNCLDIGDVDHANVSRKLHALVVHLCKGVLVKLKL